VQRLLPPSLLTFALLWANPCAGNNATDPAADPSHQAGSETRWLDAVKAQREAWEQRRQSLKEAADMRRKHLDPWGAAQIEAQERSAEMRREQARQHIEQQRKSAEAQLDANRQATENYLQQRQQMLHSYPPYGWNNPWYYRGY
jgi:hypothetical protein